MATRNYTIEVDKVHRKVIKWTGLLNGDQGQWFPYAGYYPDVTMHVYGTPGTGLHVKPQGTMESGTPANYAQLYDATEDLIDVTTVPTIKTVLPLVEQIRPDVVGDGTTNVTVVMELKS